MGPEEQMWWHAIATPMEHYPTTYYRKLTCVTCHGKGGWVDPYSATTCADCEGKGYIAKQISHAEYVTRMKKPPKASAPVSAEDYLKEVTKC